MTTDVIICSYVDLRRNYADMPFLATMLEVQKSECVSRAVHALDAMPEKWILYSLKDLSAGQVKELQSEGILHSLQGLDPASAVLVREDRTAAIYLLYEDHLCIRVYAAEGDVSGAVLRAKALAGILSQEHAFARDDRIGWLTARPQFAGTGLQAGYCLHLPMLSMMQQIRPITADIMKEHRFELQPWEPLADKNPACLYTLRNLFTAFDGSDVLIRAVGRVAQGLANKETMLRDRILAKSARSTYTDQVWRAYGVMRYARRLTELEFLAFWSKVRLGVLAGILPPSLETVDALLIQTRCSRLMALPDGPRDEHALHFARADAVRSALNGGN